MKKPSHHLSFARYMFRRGNVRVPSVIKSIDNQPTPTIDDAIKVLASIPDGKKFVVKYACAKKPMLPTVSTCTMDRKWFSMDRYTRNDRTGSI
tara:strand:+ start:432 stop:710 length:279 start_codon:yes stop_codon:yes gene_type:complete